MGKSDREARIKEINWLPMRPFDKPPTQRQRLNWLLWFGEMSKEDFIEELSNKVLEGCLKFFESMVGNIYGYLPRWTWLEDGEVKASDRPPLSAETLPEVQNLLMKELCEAHVAISHFIKDTLRPFKEGTETVKFLNCLASFSIGLSLFGKLTGDRTLRKTQSQWPADWMARIEWELSDLLDGFSLDEIKVCEECGRLYVPLKKPKGSKYCSKKCQNRATWVRHKIKQATEEGGK